jgi:hypothetical protein
VVFVLQDVFLQTVSFLRTGPILTAKYPVSKSAQ